MDNNELATELLKEVKASAKRWFIAFCIMIGLELATIIGFMWYITLPVDETVIEQEMEDVRNSNNVKQIVGDDYGEGVSESNTQTESGQAP